MTTSKLAVIGLGYVGLPLAVHFAEHGFEVIGKDKDGQKIARLMKGETYISDVTEQAIREALKKGRLTPSLPNKNLLQSADYIIVAVPTPILNEQPDLSAVEEACQLIAEQLREGQTIILESTTFPGTLEEVILPIMSRTGLTVGKDFFLGYSPERIDPGNTEYSLQRIPKVVSGQTAACLKKVTELYEVAFEQVVPVSSPRVAEMCKLFENIQRLVNISLVNEIDQLCQQLNINFRESLRAAATKPFGFTPYWPGPGVGGHCIPVDPMYFQWKAKKQGLSSQLIEQALQINRVMPQVVVDRVNEELGSVDKTEAQILLIGLTYKKDVNDLRESPALDILKLLLMHGYKVKYSDPHVPVVDMNQEQLTSCPLSANLLRAMDVIVILTDHSAIDWKMIKEHGQRIIDMRGVYDNHEER
ncbi:UDP-N-acetyl-D-mannosamine dehydrogenase [Ammoniphilus oxalaticus]|uniref:UDP-N-acetyl-D-mannosamine dehydrogenase n=1 Tax=Ammoniphilus oxalaticus TaxID=66863 RepID=A0A419SKR7_9BACL|nr:nucleotide sugar dehydrogenase [Ammoniphilus oxalaticus]RKD24607.1 UDP-N-acetyl-D-mannosamine dehydrogenase [Ammoniphilus oxalaticus]